MNSTGRVQKQRLTQMNSTGRVHKQRLTQRNFIGRVHRQRLTQRNFIGRVPKPQLARMNPRGRVPKLRLGLLTPQDEFQSRNWSDSVALAEFTNDDQSQNTPQRRSHRAGHPCRLGGLNANDQRGGPSEGQNAGGGWPGRLCVRAAKQQEVTHCLQPCPQANR